MCPLFVAKARASLLRRSASETPSLKPTISSPGIAFAFGFAPEAGAATPGAPSTTARRASGRMQSNVLRLGVVMEAPEPQSDLLTVGASEALGYPDSEGSGASGKLSFDP